MTVFFISDIHLAKKDCERTHLFIDFLKKHPKSKDKIFILGDFFEYWLGDNCMNDFHCFIAEQLASFASNNIQIYFLAGNRDFLVGEKFCTQAQITLLPETHRITLGQHAIGLTHGDQLCTHDHSYQKFRKLIRNPLLLAVLKRLPQSFKRYIAKTIRAKSKKKGQYNSSDLSVVPDDAVLDFCKKIKVQHIIHGHTHTRLEQNYEQGIKRWVLSEWTNEADILCYHNHNFSWQKITTE